MHRVASQTSLSVWVAIAAGLVGLLLIIASQVATHVWGPESLDKFATWWAGVILGGLFATIVGATVWNSFREDILEWIQS